LDIPKQFQLAGMTITTALDNTYIRTHSRIGEANYQFQKITIDPSAPNQESCEQAFYHELIHWILFVMNEDELRQNEKFVDVFGHFLYQYVKTGGLCLSDDSRVVDPATKTE